MSKQIAQLSIRELLTGEGEYRIPMYQRNYAWEEGEITQLIQDVLDSAKEAKRDPSFAHRNYYIGTLVVDERRENEHLVFETIDGQQRLTTLSLLAAYLKNRGGCGFEWCKSPKIQFESRPHSRTALDVIFNGGTGQNLAPGPNGCDLNSAILNGYRLIERIVPQKIQEDQVSWRDFADYLSERVHLMRVPVPEKTDLNHYFEIMNNRGEQLERHEVLKALLMRTLNGLDGEKARQSNQCLHAVWEACADMERYVQMGFTVAQRERVFGKDWDSFPISDFDALSEILQQPDAKPAAAPRAVSTLALALDDGKGSLDYILENLTHGDRNEAPEKETSERFQSVINFPNFLLHVLRVMLGSEEIPLDDKRLIRAFEEHLLRGEDAAANVKRFVFHLLQSRFWFDRFVIKRENLKDKVQWSLKRLRRDADGEKNRGSYGPTFDDGKGQPSEANRKILMLQAAFHVSSPTQVYKHWLNGALHYLFTSSETDASAYLKFLESLARAFVFDRYLATTEGARLEYHAIIYQNRGECRVRRDQIREKELDARLSYDGIENNFIFNFLDYLLWLKPENASMASGFEFTFRSSVEHYYPQNPMDGHERLNPNVINTFGNLCLISHSKNSRLSNYSPNAKRDHYKKSVVDSVKQRLMMDYGGDWDETAIAKHGDAMKGILLGSII